MTTRPSTRRTLVSLGALATLCAGTAQAQSTYSPYFIGISQTFSHESNMLQLADGAPEPEGFSKSDTVAGTALLAGFDQTFGRQRGYGNLSLRDNRYSHNKIFNNRSYSGNVGLNWSTVERVSGTLTASANRGLQRFNTAEANLTTVKNLESSETVGATVNVGLVTVYSIDFGVNWRRVRNSLDLAAVQARAYDQTGANAGVRWQPRQAVSLSLGLSTTKGRYPKFRTAADGSYQPDRFKRDDVYLTASYQPSGASQLNLRLTNGHTNYDLNQQRDFSGTTGSLNWVWQATGKLRFNTMLSRDTGQDSYALVVPTFFGSPITALADYSQVVNTYRLIGEYTVTGKISATASVTRMDQRIVRTTDTAALQNLSDRQRTTTASLGMRWAVLRAASLGCDYSKDTRKTELVLMLPLHNTSFSCFGQLTLQ